MEVQQINIMKKISIKKIIPRMYKYNKFNSKK